MLILKMNVCFKHLRGVLCNHDVGKCHRLTNLERERLRKEVDEVAECRVYSVIPEPESFVKIVPI